MLEKVDCYAQHPRFRVLWLLGADRRPSVKISRKAIVLLSKGYENSMWHYPLYPKELLQIADLVSISMGWCQQHKLFVFPVQS